MSTESTAKVSLKELREKMETQRGSYRRTAKIYGCTPNWVYSVLSGRQNTSTDKLERMCECALEAIKTMEAEAEQQRQAKDKLKERLRKDLQSMFPDDKQKHEVPTPNENIIPDAEQTTASCPNCDQLDELQNMVSSMHLALTECAIQLENICSQQLEATELTSDPCPDYEEQFKQLKHQLDTVRVDLFKVAKQQEVTEQIGELTKMVGEIEGRVNSLNTKLHGIEVYLGHNMFKVSKSIERIEQHLKETEQPPPLNWFKRLFSK